MTSITDTEASGSTPGASAVNSVIAITNTAAPRFVEVRGYTMLPPMAEGDDAQP